MKFISKVEITTKSGNGGDGIIAWRREARIPFGGPAGGNGGDGGSIIIVADINFNTLFHIRSKKHYFAKNGENGKNKGKHGAKSEDLRILVPCGTNIYDAEKNIKLTELLKDKEEYIISRGGRGGRGNQSFKSDHKSAPYIYERGDLGPTKHIILELESIADIGFLGFPNAGKSTLLSKISNATPVIAPFPFATLVPVLGTTIYNGRSLVFADLPGLIEGASHGRGLGFEFLKHLNRCKVLLHIVECSKTELIENFRVVEQELQTYSEKLFAKPRILVVNKIDLFSPEELKEIEETIKKEINMPYIFISASEQTNIDNLIKAGFNLFIENEDDAEPEVDYLEFVDDEFKNEELKITKEGDIWMVDSHALRYWTYKIPQNTIDNESRLLGKIEGLGVLKALEKAGAKKKDLFQINQFQFSL